MKQKKATQSAATPSATKQKKALKRAAPKQKECKKKARQKLGQADQLPGLLRWAFQGFMVLVLGVYFVWFWSHGRRTLPMKTMSVRLVDEQGQPASTRRAIMRYLAALAGWVIALGLAAGVHGAAILLVAVPFGWALIDRRRRTLYDLALSLIPI